jgi:hypothetical protein
VGSVLDLSGQPDGQLPCAPTYRRHQDVTGVNGISLKIIYTLDMYPVIGQNILNNIGFMGHQIISLPEVTTCLRLILGGIIIFISPGTFMP